MANLKHGNIVISKTSNDLFTEGKEYDIICIYCGDDGCDYNVPMVDIRCDTGDVVGVAFSNSNFIFHIENNVNVNETDMPYINSRYNPNYGDNRVCICGHTYVRHFDPYEGMDPVGCKYCGCAHFVEKKD